MRRTSTTALLTAGIVLGTACGGSGGTNPPPPPPPPPGSPSMAKAAPSGDAQTAAVGTVLPSPLRWSSPRMEAVSGEHGDLGDAARK